MKKAEYLRLLRVMNELTESVGDNLKRSVRPVYGASAKATPYHIGSAILLDIDGRKILLTAAHVIDHSDETTIYVGGNKSLFPIEGEFVATRFENDDRSRDRYDFAFLILSDQQIEALGDVPYCGEYLIAASDMNPETDQVYTAFGYPNSRNANIDNAKNHAVSTLLTYSSLAISPRDIVRKLPHGNADHLFIKYLNRSTFDDGTDLRTISARGLSGGALVSTGRLSRHLAGEKSVPKLAGLIIERKNGTLISTRLSVIVPQIKATF